MQTEKSQPTSFKRQIAITVVTSVAAVLILSSLATAIIVPTWLRTFLLSYVDHTVTEFASRSVLVYLTQSETALTNAVSAIRAIPTVQSILFLDKELRPLVRGEKVPESVKSADPKTFSEVFHWEDADSIDFIAPVRSQPPASSLGPASHTYETKPEHLGYLYVALDKSGLSTVTSTIYGVNVLIALVLGTAIILWLNRRVRNLTAPLMQLAEVMSQAAEGETGARAQVTGPTETREIATVFNPTSATRPRFSQKQDVLRF